MKYQWILYGQKYLIQIDFFNYTKYFNGIKNLKIVLSGIKSHLIEKEERLNIILDDEYSYLL